MLSITGENIVFLMGYYETNTIRVKRVKVAIYDTIPLINHNISPLNQGRFVYIQGTLITKELNENKLLTYVEPNVIEYFDNYIYEMINENDDDLFHLYYNKVYLIGDIIGKQPLRLTPL